MEGNEPASGAPPRSAPPRPGVRVGRLLGVPVFLSPSWFVLAVVVTLVYGGVVAQRRPEFGAVTAYAVGFGFVICLAISVLLHEFGHALTCRRYGIGVRSITLEMLGGYTEMADESPRPSVEAVVALAGPLVSGVLGFGGAVVFLSAPPGTVLAELALQVAASNLIVAVFNLLPGLPLDGGRALRAGIWAASGDRHAASWVAGWTGRLVAVGVAGAALLAWLADLAGPFTVVLSGIIVLTLWAGASHAIQAGRIGGRLAGLSLRELIRPAVGVPSQTPLAEALRRGETGPDTAIVVIDAADRPLAVVDEAAAGAVPGERRPWVPVDSVARTLGPGLVLPIDLTGEALLGAVRARPATEYLVVSGADVAGVLRADDLAARLAGPARMPTAKDTE